MKIQTALLGKLLGGRCLTHVDTEGSVANELALSVVTASSVKAALDLDWRSSSARNEGIRELLAQFDRLAAWLRQQFTEEELTAPPLGDAVALVERIIEQDTVPEPDPPSSGSGPAATEGPAGVPSPTSEAPPSGGEVGDPAAGGPHSSRVLRQGSVPDRLISVFDQDMRAGCKSKTKKFNGYKRHIATDADVRGLIHAVQARPANQREHDATRPLVDHLRVRGFELSELHIDRGYLAASVVRELREEGTDVVTKPPAPRKSDRFGKYDFSFDPDAKTLTCPGDTTIPYRGDGLTHTFPAKACRACPLRHRCVTPARTAGRALGTHPQESFLRAMHADLGTREGRQRRRERIPVEHALARVGQLQGRRARFRGLPKNQFDLVRTAVVSNLYVLNRLLAGPVADAA